MTESYTVKMHIRNPETNEMEIWSTTINDELCWAESAFHTFDVSKNTPLIELVRKLGDEVTVIMTKEYGR